MYVLDTAAFRRALRDLQKRIAAAERLVQQLNVKDDAEVYNFRSHQSRTIKKENRPPLNDDATYGAEKKSLRGAEGFMELLDVFYAGFTSFFFRALSSSQEMHPLFLPLKASCSDHGLCSGNRSISGISAECRRREARYGNSGRWGPFYV